MKKGLLLALMPFFLSSCFTDVVSNFNVTVGQNEVTTTADFSDDFALNLSGAFDIDVQDVNYGQIFLNASNDESPFQVGITANLASFTTDVWTGFGTTNQLPNGDYLPGWIQPNELVEVDIPSFHEEFELHTYVGPWSPYYLGIAVTLKVFDDHYPQGLQISQNFRAANDTWGTVMVFGPSYNEDGSVAQHGGVFFVATFDPIIPGTISFEKFDKKSIKFHGPQAHFYENNEKEQKKAFKQLKKLIKKFNKKMSK